MLELGCGILSKQNERRDTSSVFAKS
jgi:hypothetical protein